MVVDREGDDQGEEQDVVKVGADGDWDVEGSNQALFALGLVFSLAAGQAAVETVSSEIEDT